MIVYYEYIINNTKILGSFNLIMNQYTYKYSTIVSSANLMNLSALPLKVTLLFTY